LVVRSSGVCCNLIVVDNKLDVFRFAHLSVREYLESRADFAQPLVHVIAAERCLQVCLRNLQVKSTKINSLNRYATLYWAIHCQKCGMEQRSGGKLRELCYHFLERDGAGSPFANWTSAARSALWPLSYPDPLRYQLMDTFSLPPHSTLGNY
jgi:hypothetical protein